MSWSVLCLSLILLFSSLFFSLFLLLFFAQSFVFFSLRIYMNLILMQMKMSVTRWLCKVGLVMLKFRIHSYVTVMSLWNEIDLFGLFLFIQNNF